MGRVLRAGMPFLGVLLVALVLSTILSRDDTTAQARMILETVIRSAMFSLDQGVIDLEPLEATVRDMPEVRDMRFVSADGVVRARRHRPTDREAAVLSGVNDGRPSRHIKTVGPTEVLTLTRALPYAESCLRCHVLPGASRPLGVATLEIVIERAIWPWTLWALHILVGALGLSLIVLPLLRRRH